MRPYVSIVIPTFNEADNITKAIAGIKRSLRRRSYEIIIVDRHSPDGTANKARASEPSFSMTTWARALHS